MRPPSQHLLTASNAVSLETRLTVGILVYSPTSAQESGSRSPLLVPASLGCHPRATGLVRIGENIFDCQLGCFISQAELERRLAG